MLISKEELFNEAINLSPMDKAKLVEYVLASFNFQGRKEIDDAWKIEIEDRLSAYKSGNLKKIPIEDVFCLENCLDLMTV